MLAQGRDPAFKTQQGHGDFPAIARLANQVVGSRPGLIKKHFVKLAGTGQLADRLNPDLALAHRHQQERQTAMADAARFGTHQHKAPVRLVGQRSPDLLPADQPLPAVTLAL